MTADDKQAASDRKRVPSDTIDPPPSSPDERAQSEQDQIAMLAGSANKRDVHERMNHDRTRDNWLEDERQRRKQLEDSDQKLRPEVAELRQAKKTAKASDFIEGVAITLGGLFLGIPSFLELPPPEADTYAAMTATKWTLFGLGVAAIFFSVVSKSVMFFFGWPKTTQN